MKKEGVPSKEWLARFEEMKNLFASPNDFGEIFSKKEAFGKKLFLLEMGDVHFPTGEVLVRDPLVFLNKNEKPYFQKVPTGRFPLTTLVVEVEEEHYRYVASRVKLSDKKAVTYTEALVGGEDIEGMQKGEYFGFKVDAGLATVVDVKTRDLYADFEKEWYQKNPEGNIYDDFFAVEFEKNYQRNPKFQRKDGDWINFQIPGSDVSVPMIQTGYGDGCYPVYFGYDENGNVCELVMEFLDLQLAFGQ